MPELTVQCLSKLSSTDGASDQALPYLQQLRDWVAGYLTQPHAELGRAGPVCPFARPTLDHDLLWYAVVHGDSPPLPEVVARLRELTAKFGSLPPEQGPDSLLKAALIVFPDVRDTSFIDRVQQTLKPDFVAAGLMIGAAAWHGEPGTGAGPGQTDLEVRAFFPVGDELREDPVTGSLNASLGQWLTGPDAPPTPWPTPSTYVARQGAALGRDGRVRIARRGDTVWVGGDCQIVVEGTLTL